MPRKIAVSKNWRLEERRAVAGLIQVEINRLEEMERKSAEAQRFGYPFFVENLARRDWLAQLKSMAEDAHCYLLEMNRDDFSDFIIV